jgi:HPt (histidine-containing phosphotransfer) domain-containing protein
MKGFEQECLDAGCSGYFSKPIDIDLFMEMMAERLGGQPLEKETGLAPTPPAGSPPDRVVAEGESGAAGPIFSKLPGSSGKFRHLIVRFVARLKERLQAVEQARLKGQLKEIAAFAHWLRGAGGTVGFDEFTAPAARLEKLAKEGGGEPEIQQVILHLTGLADRLAIPDAKPTDASVPIGGLTREPSTDRELPRAIANSRRAA